MGDLIGNEIADKIKSILKRFSVGNSKNDTNSEIEVPKKRCISPEESNKLLMN